MKKSGLYLTIFVVIVVLMFYFVKLRGIESSYSYNDFNFDVPKILPIKRNFIEGNYIENPKVWGLRFNSSSELLLYGKKNKKRLTMDKFVYEYEELRGIPVLFRVSNKKYRWEFYGTVYENKYIKAIFYNPSLRENKILLLPEHSYLDKDLFIKEIKNNYVEVVERTKRGNKRVFKLRVFKISSKFIKEVNK